MKKTLLFLTLGIIFTIVIIGIVLYSIRTSSPNPINRAICGDGFCEYPEDSNNCPQDCQEGQGGYTCGDGICSSQENSNNCNLDCGVPTPYCGNEICQSSRGEDKYECPLTQSQNFLFVPEVRKVSQKSK